MFRRILTYAVLTVVGGVLVGPALAKSTMRSCSNVTVGHYQAINIRAASNLGCKTARSDLSLWLKQPTKLPHNAKSWHAKLVKGTWQMAYGKYSTSLYFVLVNLTAPKPTPGPTATPTPLPISLPTPLPQPQPTSTPTPTPPTQSQTITFTSSVPSNPIAGGTYAVAATASSKLSVTLSIDPGSSACSLKGSVVTFTGAGTCVIDANQAGDSSYEPAAQITQSFTVLPASSLQVSLTVGGQPLAGSYPWSKTRQTAVASCGDATGLTCRVTATVDGGAVTSPDSISLPTDAAGKSHAIVVSATDNAGGSVSKTYTYSVTAIGYYALTFDDGPNPTYTAPVLAALQDQSLPGLIPGPTGQPSHIPATFMLVGGAVASDPGLAQQEGNDGFAIGDHTWDHLNIGDSTDTVNPFDTIPCTGETATTTPVFGSFFGGIPLTKISGLCPQYEIEDTALLIHQTTGVWPQWFRPPFGDYGPGTGPSANNQTNPQNTTTLLSQVTTDLAKVAPTGSNPPATMSITAWSTDSLDWCDRTDTSTCLAGHWGTAAAVAANAEAVPSGGIILMHDAQQTTADAIPLIVNAEAAKGLLPGKLATTTIAQAGPWVPLPPYFVAATAP